MLIDILPDELSLPHAASSMYHQRSRFCLFFLDILDVNLNMFQISGPSREAGISVIAKLPRNVDVVYGRFRADTFTTKIS
jgi:hypothetical protein